MVKSFIQTPLVNLQSLSNFFNASQVVTLDEYTVFTRQWMDAGIFRRLVWIPPGGEDSKLDFVLPGDNQDYQLKPYQKSEVERAKEQKSCILSRSSFDDTQSITVLYPVFGPDDNPLTNAQTYQGMLLGQFMIENLVEKPLSHVPPLGLSFEIISGSPPGGQVLFNYNDTIPDYRKRIPLFFADEPLIQVNGFPFADSTWSIVVKATPGYVMTNSSLLPWLILFGGILLSVLLSIYLYQRAVQKKAFVEKVRELDRFFNLTLELLCITDTTGRFIRVNPEWERILGYPLETLRGSRFIEFVHPDDITATLEAVEYLSRGNMIKGFVNRYRCVDGTYRWIEWRSIARDDIIYAAARDITESREREERLLQTLEEKDILLKEVHHRVKNNLQIITSMLNLEMEKVSEPMVKEQLLHSRHRIDTLAMVHESLYSSDTMSGIDFSNHIQDLVSLYQKTKAGSPIYYTLELARGTMPLNTALPCGLIVNELLTNSIQHALPGVEHPEITITFAGSSDRGGYVLTVSDNGPGMPENSDPSGLGLQLVTALVAQINGILEVKNDSGALFRISFPAEELEEQDTAPVT